MLKSKWYFMMSGAAIQWAFFAALAHSLLFVLGAAIAGYDYWYAERRAKEESKNG